MSGHQASSVDEVLDLYRRWGEHTYDEEITQLAHALQCAELAARDGASDELIAAALLHDVGHLLEIAAGHDFVEGTDLEHETLGAAYVSTLFPAGVTMPIGLHVLAKRYLCAVEPDYPDALSAGSAASLDAQGGPLDQSGVDSFVDQPGRAGAVALRRWDDTGKQLDHVAPGLDTYAGLLARLSLEPR